MKQVKAYGTKAVNAPLEELTISRRSLRPSDVEFEVLYCGICHSDLHSIKGDFGEPFLPLVPGHEILGRVTAIGADVSGSLPPITHSIKTFGAPMYLIVKHSHLVFVVITVVLFNLRFWMRTILPSRPVPKVLRFVPHINDTLLLFTGMMLMTITRYVPFGNADWLGVKLILVVDYGRVCW